MEYRRQYRQMPDETKQKISQALKGRSKGITHKDNISTGLKKYWSQVPNKPIDDNQ